MQERAPRGTALLEWRSGWPIVLTATIGIAVAGMNYPVIGAMMRPLSEAFGWSRAEIAFALTISAIIGPLSNILVGMLSDRIGPRPVVLWGTILFGLIYACFGLAGPSIQAWYAIAVPYAIICHVVGPVAWTMAVVRHFHASRGLALAISLSGSGIVMSLAPAIVLFLLGNVGVRGVFYVLGAGAAVLMFIPAWFFFREARADDAVSGQARAPDAPLAGMSVREALAGTRYWRIGLALIAVSGTIGTFVVHFQSMLMDTRLDPADAATAALMIGPMMIIGRLGTGLLFDRFPAPLVASIAFSLPLLGCLLMLGFDGTLIYALLCAAVIGLGVGAEVDVVAYLTSRYFGLKHYGVLFGLMMGLYGLGVGVGAALAGRVFDITGSYNPMLVVLGAGCTLAVFLVATLGRPGAISAARGDAPAAPAGARP